MFRQTLLSLLTSKKAIAAFVGLILSLLARAGIVLSPDSVTEILTVIVGYMVSQGIADVGKEAVKAESSF